MNSPEMRDCAGKVKLTCHLSEPDFKVIPESEPDSVLSRIDTGIENERALESEKIKIAPSVGEVGAWRAANFNGNSVYDWPIAQKRYFDLKQAFNAVYFAAAIGCLAFLFSKIPITGPIQLMAMLSFSLIGFFCLGLSICAAWSSFIRPRPSDFEFKFSRKQSAFLRALALLIPLPLMATVPLILLSNAEYDRGMQLTVGNDYQGASRHFLSAVSLNPLNEPAYAALANCGNFTFDYASTLKYADIALGLRSNDDSVLADKAWALNQLNRYGEALPVALKATELGEENGQAFSSLAEAYFGLGRYEEALIASETHVALHPQESDAYNQRGNIFEKLGREAEAEDMRNIASQLAKSP